MTAPNSLHWIPAGAGLRFASTALKAQNETAQLSDIEHNDIILIEISSDERVKAWPEALPAAPGEGCIIGGTVGWAQSYRNDIYWFDFNYQQNGCWWRANFEVFAAEPQNSSLRIKRDSCPLFHLNKHPEPESPESPLLTYAIEINCGANPLEALKMAGLEEFPDPKAAQAEWNKWAEGREDTKFEPLVLSSLIPALRGPEQEQSHSKEE